MTALNTNVMGLGAAGASYMLGHLVATIDKDGQITVETWNDALSAARAYAEDSDV